MRLTSLQTGWRPLVPLVVAGVVALGVAVPLTAGASTALPPRTAAQLLADLDRVDVAGYAGTVVQKSTLLDGPTVTTAGLSLSRLMAGTNTIKVWYGGPSRQRIAVLDATGENDLYRDGQQVWQWDSDARRATYQSVSTIGDTVQPVPIPIDGTTVTPDDLARQAVAAIGPSTTVAVGAPSTVAGRSVYQLVLTPPADSGTRIGRVVLSLDGGTRMPLAAQVFAHDAMGADDPPAIDLTFTRISFGVPDASTFGFVPPAGATISTYDTVNADLASSPDPLLGVLATTTVGTGWTRVAIISPPNAGTASQDATTAQFGDRVVDVSGTWGGRALTGKLLRTSLLSMLFVEDGRIVVGAVAPAALYAALE